MKKQFQSVLKKDVGLIRSEAVVEDHVQYDYCGYSVLHAAASAGWVAGVRHIIDHKILDVNVVDSNWTNTTPLHLASIDGHTDVVRLLLSGGADVNIADRFFLETPLHLASRVGRLEVAALLIDAGANLEAKDSDSKSTPLLLAADQGNTSVVKLLIDRGADVSAKDSFGYDYKFFLARNNGDLDQSPDPEMEKMIDEFWKLLDGDR